MGKASRLRAIRRSLRGDQPESVRIKLSSLDDICKFYVGEMVTLPGVKGIYRCYRDKPVYITAVDEVNGIITVGLSAPS